MGDATTILEGSNSVRGFSQEYPGIYVPEGHTLTIKGDGALTAGIGGGYEISCGNIVVEGGTITATGGAIASGLGSGWNGSCGNITISYTVHKVTATKGRLAPYSIGAQTCGNVTIGSVAGAISDSTYTYYGTENTSGDFSVNINTAAYNTKSIAFWGRKLTGHNDDDSYKVGEWTKLKEWKGSLTEHTGNQKFTVSRDYVELGFEFNAVTGTIWPYSGVFWKAAQTQAEKINSVAITFAGTAKKPTIRINVNNREVYSNKSCINHARYIWNDSALSFTLKSSSAYASSNSLYGRKIAGKNEDGTTKMGSWVKLLTLDVPLLRSNSVTVTKARDVTESDENNPNATNIDLSGNVYYIPRDYVELGYEFETINGLSRAYSNVFWTAANAKTESADTIFVEQAGTSRRPSLKVTVNNNITVGAQASSLNPSNRDTFPRVRAGGFLCVACM